MTANSSLLESDPFSDGVQMQFWKLFLRPSRQKILIQPSSEKKSIFKEVICSIGEEILLI